jgi:glycosyltransferase involved in cell wall biosynthesis
MPSAVLFVDNLRIGGFQRLALDQAYGLSELGFTTTIYVLDDVPQKHLASFFNVESEIISRLQVRILWIGKTRRSQMQKLFQIVQKGNSDWLVLSHSLRATFLVSLVNLKFGSRVRVISTIHQLPTLSASRQRFIRFVYAQFSWKLLAYSVAVKADWDARVQNNFFFKNLIARKEIDVMRNGIYLKRLPLIPRNRQDSSPPRLVYLGRNTSWKGVSTFLNIAMSPQLSNFHILFMVPNAEDIDLSFIDRGDLSRISILAGKTISSYEPRSGDVHLYPANYGEAAKYVESVSLNCLELACIGIPTLLSINGLSTWPDLISFDIFHETDWVNQDEVVEKILRISSLHFQPETLETIASIIDIKNQLRNLVKLSKTGVF